LLRDAIAIEDVLDDAGTPGKKIRCPNPDHPDENPSGYRYEDHVHCFGCGFHGDVTDIWAARKGFGSPVEAALDLAQEFGVRLPALNPNAQRQAQERRERQDSSAREALKCHEALKKEENAHVCEWWAGRGFSPELQERFLLGTNRDGTEAIIPFWYRGKIEGVIRRKFEGDPKYLYPKAEEFASGARPLFIPVVPLKDEVFLVEGPIDALAVAAMGQSVIAVGGSHLSAKQAMVLDQITRNARVFILPDRDEVGEKAARAWAQQLYPRAALCRPDYGSEDNKDAADLFKQFGSEEALGHLARLATKATDLIDAEIEVAKADKDWRSQFRYAQEHIVPLLARIEPESMRVATLDIVQGELAAVKKAWLQSALKEEVHRINVQGTALAIQAMKEAQEQAEQEHRERVDKAQEEIDAILEPGVLERMRKQAAKMHNVKRDKEPLRLAILVAVGAQLAPLPSGRPLGASMLLTGEAGRGKNHNVDAAVLLLPPEFYFEFEIASGQSLYYQADEDPDFLRHTFAYPNEIEGAEALWEFLRPMLSKGRAKKIVTAKDADGNMTTRTIIVEGPVTIAIPTIRNKTDEQLQTRLLVSELADYPGRVKEHSKGVSEQMHPNFAQLDFSHERFVWREALRQLTVKRRVVAPISHPDFALDDDSVSHGARLWANLMGLMAAHGWLEQRNREVMLLENGEEAIVATAQDYAAAHKIFSAVCKRSVINLSQTHRKILGSLYDLEIEFPNREGFTTREIASGAKVSPQTVSNNKTFLVTSARMIKETEDGLALIHGADPTWWAAGDLTAGLPSPEKAASWWEDTSEWTKNAGQSGQSPESGRNPDTYGEFSVQGDTGQALDVSILDDAANGHHLVPAGRVHQGVQSDLDSENGIDKPDSEGEEGVSTVSTAPEDPGVEI
jgi:DNA primase